MANIVERTGWVQVRVGGNTQENAELVPSLPDGTILAKDYSNAFGPTKTPPLEFTADLLYLMANISKLTNTYWFLGPCLYSLSPPTQSLKLHQYRHPFLQHDTVFPGDRPTGSANPWRLLARFPGSK